MRVSGMKKNNFWRSLGNLLFQNALILILIFCFSQLTFAVTKLTGSYSNSEWHYVSPLALVVWAAALAGQIYCLIRDQNDHSDKNE